MFEKVLQAVREFDRIIIHRHSRPDGDAMGSQIGLKYLLLENFPGKQVLVVGDRSAYLQFMEGSEMDDVPDEAYSDALAIVLDCGARHLICDERYALAKKTVRIDHHLFAETIADVEVIDSSFESCCGMIAAFARESGLRLNPLAAKSLYTGMITDSGRFRYDSTSARTFALASYLMEQKFDLSGVYRELYAESMESKKLKAHFITRIQTTPQQVAYVYTTREELAAMKADTFTVSRGMVNTMSDIKGVDIWVNFTETEQGVLCELRSAKYNINPVAVKYGGGGHAKASGATVADKKTAMAMLEDLNALVVEE